jgi:hypothetical protein
MPLTRTPAAGWLSDGSAIIAAMISSRFSSLIQSESSGLASPKLSAESFCISALVVTTALRAHSSHTLRP